MNEEEAAKKASEEAKQAAIAKMNAAIEKDKATTPVAPIEGKTVAAKKPVQEPRISLDDKGVPTLKQVKVYSPFRVYFDGPAQSISAVSKTGPFDVLPGHKNFMTLLEPCEVNVRTDKGEHKFTIARGIMHVRRNLVTVFLDV